MKSEKVVFGNNFSIQCKNKYLVLAEGRTVKWNRGTEILGKIEKIDLLEKTASIRWSNPSYKNSIVHPLTDFFDERILLVAGNKDNNKICKKLC